MQAPRDELDTYEKMEHELDPSRTEVEVVLELAVRGVEDRLIGVATEGAPFDVSTIPAPPHLFPPPLPVLRYGRLADIFASFYL